MKKFERFSIEKRILWCWETICYSLFAEYVLNMIFKFNPNDDTWIIPFCAPTSVLMMLFGEYIYEDKIKWKDFKTHQIILPIVVFWMCGVYFWIKYKRDLFLLSIGMLFTWILIGILAVKYKNKLTKD